METKHILRFAVLCIVMLSSLVWAPALPASASSSSQNETPAASLSDPGPYQVSSKTVSITRSDSSTFNATLYYPATSTASGAPLDGSGAPYPAITFGHGAFFDPGDYDGTFKHLASYGYFVIATQSYGVDWALQHFGETIPAVDFGADMRSCLTYLEQQNASAGSPYYHKVNTSAFGAFGHSAGGHAAIQAAADDARIKVLAGMAPDGTTAPSAINTVASVHVPYRILAGSCDGTTPVKDHAQPIYNKAHAPRQLAILQGGYHNGMADKALIDGFPPENCSAGETKMTRAVQLPIVRKWLTSWFNYYLKNDTSLKSEVWGAGLTADPLVKVQAENTGDIPLPPLPYKLFIPIALQ